MIMIKKSLIITNVVNSIVFLLTFFLIREKELYLIPEVYYPLIDLIILVCPVINLLTILFVGFPDSNFRKNVIYVVLYILSIVVVNIVFRELTNWLIDLRITLAEYDKHYVITWIKETIVTLEAWLFTYHLLQMNLLLITMIVNKIRTSKSLMKFIVDNKILLICAGSIFILNNASYLIENGISDVSYLCRCNIIIIFLLLVNIYYASYSKVMKIIANIIMVITTVVFVYCLTRVILDNDSSYYLMNLFICGYIIGISLFIWGLSWIIYRFKWYMNKKQ